MENLDAQTHYVRVRLQRLMLTLETAQSFLYEIRISQRQHPSPHSNLTKDELNELQKTTRENHKLAHVIEKHIKILDQTITEAGKK